MSAAHTSTAADHSASVAVADFWPSASPRWPWMWAGIALLLTVIGFLIPPADPDLPLHLLHGAHMLATGMPLPADATAWTQPVPHDYAYSWAPEVVFTLLWQVGGAVLLRAGLVIPMLVAAFGVRTLGRIRGWHPSVAGVMAVATGIVVAGASMGPRPVYWLVALFPMTWTFAFALGAAPASGGARIMRMAALGLFGVGVLAINMHMFAPLLFVCLAATWRAPSWRLWMVRGGIGTVALALGLLCTPFPSHVLAVLRLASQAPGIMQWPSLVSELQPGFALMQLDPESQLVGVLLFLPLLWPAGWSWRERMICGVPWAIGALAYGISARFGIVWWMLAVPAVGEVVAAAVGRFRTPSPRLAQRLLPVFLLVPTLLPLLGTVRRVSALDAIQGPVGQLAAPLPTLPGAYATEAFARLLECALPASASPRLATHFGDGSYVAWRLHPWRVSQTTTGIFPDSVVSADRLLWPHEVPTRGPWRQADVAMVIPTSRVGVAFQRDTAYALLAGVVAGPEAPPLARGFKRELWVRRSYWTAHAIPAAQGWLTQPPVRVGYGRVPAAAMAACAPVTR